MKLQDLGCGNCGNHTFYLYEDKERNAVLAECTKCEDITVIKPTTKLEFEWGLHSEGILCPMERSHKK